MAVYTAMLLRMFVAVSLAAGAAAQTCQDWLNRGVQAYRSADYAEAVSHFQQAIALNPGAVEPHLYLATAYMTQWIPGAVSRENDELARQARTEFETVLGIDPRNKVALASLASLAFNEAAGIAEPAAKSAKLDDAANWNRRIADVDPQAREAWYSLGVIAWSKWYPALAAARAQAGMRPEDPGPLNDFNTRRDLRAEFGGVIDDGIQSLRKALSIDPAYDDAMAYLNLLIRERADLRDSVEEYRADIMEADEWVQKALDTKRRKAEASMPATQPSPASGVQRIRVAGVVQASNLVTKVDPVYPPLAQQARVQGTVRFDAVIGNDGRIRTLQLLGGHPLLIPSATEAVRQWVYRPTLLNGEPVEVSTVIDVPFTLPSSSSESRRLRLGMVPDAKLITKVEPQYPPLARQARVQGTVRLSAVIGKDGHVRDLQLLSGHPLLVPSATEAVRQWIYRPTLLDGEPVEVVTVIDVPFTLSR